MKILFTSPGRRVELIKLFRNEFSKVYKDVKFYGADFTNISPSLYFLDKVFKLPYKIDKKYILKILEIAKAEKISIIIPLIDPELSYFSEYKELFLKNGIFVMISNEESIEISSNKWKTFLWAQRIGIKVPKTYIYSDLKEINRDIEFPVILKPIRGSSSRGIFICETKKEFSSILSNVYINNYIIQQYLEGEEITVDIFGTEDGNLIFESQRKRLKTRGGEIERGVTQNDIKLTEVVKTLVKYFKPNGVINAQFIKSKKNQEYYLIEINARFGGGYPLSHMAGANYIKLLIDLYSGTNLILNKNNYIVGLFMMRYDNALYKKSKELIKLQ